MEKIISQPTADKVDELLRILEEVFPGIVEELLERIRMTEKKEKNDGE